MSEEPTREEVILGLERKAETMRGELDRYCEAHPIRAFLFKRRRKRKMAAIEQVVRDIREVFPKPE